MTAAPNRQAASKPTTVAGVFWLQMATRAPGWTSCCQANASEFAIRSTSRNVTAELKYHNATALGRAATQASNAATGDVGAGLGPANTFEVYKEVQRLSRFDEAAAACG